MSEASRAIVARGEEIRMKTILIEQAVNGWIVLDREDCSLNSYRPGDVHVYRTIGELQADLPRLLAMSAEEIEEILKKTLDKSPMVQQP